MQRRALLAGSAALLFAPARARSQALTAITVAASGSDDVIAALWAVENGAFRKAGLDVAIQKLNSGGAVTAAVAGGGVEIGKSSLVSLMTARAKGIPFVVVAPAGVYSAGGPTAGMIVAKDSPIKTGKDCNGKTFAVSALNDLTALGTMAWVDKNGGDSKSLHFVEMPPSSIAEAVAAGRIDGGTMPNPPFARAIESGTVRFLCYPVSAIARLFLNGGFFATADDVARRKDVIAAFRRAIDDAGAYANRHRAQMVPLIAKFTGAEPNVILSQPQQLVGTSLDLKMIQPLVDVAAAYKVIPAGFDARAMIDSGAA